MHCAGVPLSRAHQFRLRGENGIPGYASSYEMRAKFSVLSALRDRMVTDRAPHCPAAVFVCLGLFGYHGRFVAASLTIFE